MAYLYPGLELEVFRHAKNWKGYFKDILQAYIKGDVLEIGAGVGGTTRVLYCSSIARWVCLEPDPTLATQLQQTIEEEGFPSCQIKIGTIKDLKVEEIFDCILYIDVLEHIENDATELLIASSHLKTNGKLILLAPAHFFLFSQLDKQAGHFRRYTIDMIRKITPTHLTLETFWYLDSLGFFASLMNRYVYQAAQPTLTQLLFWDKYLIPLSRIFDRLLKYRFGKTIVAVWSTQEPHCH